MSDYEIGIRKNVEYGHVQYWLLINAKNLDGAVEPISTKEKFSPVKKFNISTKFIYTMHWNIFIIVTVMINTLISINYFLQYLRQWYLALIIIAHMTCFVYWIDFIIVLLLKILEKKNKTGTKIRSAICLTADGISLIPLSIAYLIVQRDIYTVTFWSLRLVTLLRFYRIPVFLKNITTAGRNFCWIFITGCIIYLIVAIDTFANVFYVYYDTETNIHNWNETIGNKFLVCLYFSTITYMNVGLGDIVISKLWERIATIIAIFSGYVVIAGVITGTLAFQIQNKDKKRELFRQDYKAIKLNLKEMNLEKKVLEKISENAQATWKYKTGHTGGVLIQLLPTSMQKEILFDINFAFLNRSLIFSKQPRAFLRSVVLQMKNISYLPGDIVAESSGMAEGMFCIASGVIEILSEENDDTPIISFTNGTIMAEAALFISIPVRCVIRAATYVELQVLMKVNFAKVGLRYPEIYRSMQAQIYERLNFKEEPEPLVKTLDLDFYELSRKKAAKRLIHNLKRQRKEETNEESSASLKSQIMTLYVWSENIPKVKIFPINLVQGKPWILRPKSFFLEVWEICILVVINIAVYLYPYLAAFSRKISNVTYFFMILTDLFYVCDLIVQCLTAIEKKNNFTYIISIRKIIMYRLTTVGFYFDILATYNFNIYAEVIWPQQADYMYIILSLNRLLKWWRVIKFFKKQENNLNGNLLLIVTVKYIYYCSVLVWWIGALLYLEACPEERCVEDRWFAQLELQEADNPSTYRSITNFPELVSIYYAIILLYGVGYGDLAPTAVVDCVFLMLTSYVGTCLQCLTKATASSTFRHLARSRTHYQEEIFAVERFMEEHDLPQVYKSKVKNYFRLQWNYDQGFILKHANVAEGIHGHQKTIILNQMMKKFLAVPIFQDVGDEFLRMLTKLSRLCILPPDEMVVEEGSLAREMYILESGYCEVSTNEEADRVRIIGPVNSFGFLEMLLGTPMEMNVRTVTHARIISVDYSTYLRAATKFPAVKKQIDDILKTQYGPETRRKWDNLGFEPLKEQFLVSNVNTLQKTLPSSTILNVYKYHKNLEENYWKPFAAWGKFRIFQFFLLPFVILPRSIFIKVWMPIRLINVFMIGIIAPIHYSLPKSTASLKIPLIIMLVLIYIDMYLMFHVAYYDNRGLLMYHPAKTAVSYLKGNFVLDLITIFPFDLIVSSVMDQSVVSYYSMKLIVVLQFYKIWQVSYYLETDIMKKTDYIKILKFVPLAIIVTNIITGLLIIVECSYYYDIQIPNNASTLKNQLLQGLKNFCPQNTNDIPEYTDLSPFKLYIIVYYWVTYTMTQIGFGDVNDHNFRALVAVIIIVTVGVFLYAYVFASLTSVMLSLYNVVTNYRRMILEMLHFMKLKNVTGKIKSQMLLHYQYNWLRTEGATPQTLFSCLHTQLRENIVAKMYEDTIRQIPAFAQIDKPLIRLIGKHLHEIYFLRGETIVNYHDAQEYIYLIYTGKVEVMSNTREFITSLRTGGLFGNITNKPFCLSSLIISTAKNSDILRVDSAIFFKALQVIPEAKSLLDYLTSQKDDFIEPLSTRNSTSSGTYPNRRNTIPFEITKLRTIRPDINFSSMDLSKDKKYFHFNNTIYKNPQKPFLTFVILPNSTLYKTIDICTVVLAYWSFVITIYMFAFQDFSPVVLAMSYAFDVLFYIEIILRFHLSFFDKHWDIVVNKTLIRQRYFQAKMTVAMDVITNLPLELFALSAPTDWVLPVLSILRLNKLLRIRFIFEFYRRKFKVLMMNKVYLHLSYSVIIISLILHVFSCIFYFIVCPIGIVQPNTWFTRMELEKVEKWRVYTVASYFTCTLFTTTGFGDIPIFSTIELITSITFMILAPFTVAWMAGGIASIAAAQGWSLFNYQERITELKSNFIRQNISKYQLTKMWYYVSSLWHHNAGKQVPEFIMMAPYALKCEIMNEMLGSHLSEAYPFSQMEEAFLRQLAIYLKRTVYFPGNYILKQGDTDRTMYFIHTGEVLVLTIRPDLMETIHFTLTENDHFGMTQGLILDRPHTFSYRAATEVEIFSLTLNQWDHLFRYFPDAKQKIYQRINALPPTNQETSRPVLNT